MLVPNEEVLNEAFDPRGGLRHLAYDLPDNLTVKEAFSDRFSFAFIRNPMDRLVSVYNDKFNQDDVRRRLGIIFEPN